MSSTGKDVLDAEGYANLRHTMRFYVSSGRVEGIRHFRGAIEWDWDLICPSGSLSELFIQDVFPFTTGTPRRQDLEWREDAMLLLMRYAEEDGRRDLFVVHEEAQTLRLASGDVVSITFGSPILGIIRYKLDRALAVYLSNDFNPATRYGGPGGKNALEYAADQGHTEIFGMLEAAAVRRSVSDLLDSIETPRATPDRAPE